MFISEHWAFQEWLSTVQVCPFNFHEVEDFLSSLYWAGSWKFSSPLCIEQVVGRFEGLSFLFSWRFAQLFVLSRVASLPSIRAETGGGCASMGSQHNCCQCCVVVIVISGNIGNVVIVITGDWQCFYCLCTSPTWVPISKYPRAPFQFLGPHSLVF